MEDNKEYYAFISYKREDEKWAKWLQHKLEHYKFPTNLNGRTDLPKHIRPTFRDVTDLEPGLLAEKIGTALRNSQWLIVVCSPRAAKSPWVCKEAQTFIDLGRADRIIPFVIEGNPFSNDTATECYPEALLSLTGSNELLSANINEMGRDAAVIKVVARMFGLRFDTLWQRHERERRRRRNWIIATVAVSVLVILGVAGYILLLNRQLEIEKTEAIAARKIAEGERDRAENEKNRANQEKKRAEQAEDSILLTNMLLTEERNNLSKANKQVLINESRLLAEFAMKKCDGGDYREARRLALAALPHDLNNPERPFVIEAEAALRRSCEYNSYVLESYDSFLLPKSQIQYDTTKRLIYGSCGNGIGVWDATSGALKSCWRYDDSQDPRIWSISLNRDAGKILFPCWSGFAIANTKNGEILDTFYSSCGKVGLFDEKGNRIIMALYNGEIITREPVSKRILSHSIYGKPNCLNYIDFLPQKNIYLRNGIKEKDLVIADIATSDVKCVLRHKCEVGSACFSPTGKYVATTTDSTIHIWRLGDSTHLRSANLGKQGFNGISFSPNEEMIAVTNDFGECTVLDANTLLELKKINDVFFEEESIKHLWFHNSLFVGNKVIDLHGNYSKMDEKECRVVKTVNEGIEVDDELIKTIPRYIVDRMTGVYYDTIDTIQYEDGIIATTEEIQVSLISICHDDNNKFVLAFNSDDEAVLWKGKTQVRRHYIYGDVVPGVAGVLFISNKGSIYGYDGNVYRTSDGKVVGNCGWTAPALFHEEKYMISDGSIRINKEIYQRCLVVTDIETGQILQRIITPYTFEHDFHTIESDVEGNNIVITDDNGNKIKYPFLSLCTLIEKVRKNLPISNKNEVTKYDYTQSPFLLPKKDEDDI